MDGLAFFAGGTEVLFGVGFFINLGEGGVCLCVRNAKYVLQAGERIFLENNKPELFNEAHP